MMTLNDNQYLLLTIIKDQRKVVYFEQYHCKKVYFQRQALFLKHFVLMTKIQEKATKRTKTIKKQGPISINQTGMSIVLQKQWHVIS